MSNSSNNNTATGGGISVGAVLAFIISYKLWHSLLWALLSATGGWIYVIYAVIFYLDKIKAWLN